MTTRPRSAITFELELELGELSDPFLPPAAVIPPVAHPAALAFADAIRVHDLAEAALAVVLAASRSMWPAGLENNERGRLLAERHPAALAERDAANALRRAREVFRMEGILRHRDEWETHLAALVATELADASEVVREAAMRIRAAALVPATYTGRLEMIARMVEGATPAGWWVEARRPAWIAAGARLVSLDRELLPALEALAGQLDPPSAAGEPSDGAHDAGQHGASVAATTR